MSDLYAERSYTIPAGGLETVQFVGGHIRLLSASGDVSVMVDDRKAENLKVGIGLPVPQGFSKVQFINDGGADVDIVVAFSAVGVTDDRINVNGNISLAPDEGLTGLDDVTIATGGADVVAPANSLRRAVIVSALAANTGTVRVGGTDVAANRGQELAPAGVVVFETTAAVWVRNDTGANQAFSVVEVLR